MLTTFDPLGLSTGLFRLSTGMLQPTKDLAEAHYHDLKERPFFPRLTNYLSSAPVVAMVWEGEDIVKQGRNMIGATSPLASAAGTIRGDLSIVVENKCVSASYFSAFLVHAYRCCCRSNWFLTDLLCFDDRYGFVALPFPFLCPTSLQHHPRIGHY